MQLPVIVDSASFLNHLRAIGGLPDQDLQNGLGRLPRNDLPDVVYAMHLDGLLGYGSAAWAVPYAWSGAEHPMGRLGPEAWAELFDEAGYTYNGRPRERPRTPLTLYRGADDAHRDGWSWTESPELAIWFAGRTIHNHPGVVWQATVDPWRLLARITDERPGEDEYIVNTAGLTITRATCIDGLSE